MNRPQRKYAKINKPKRRRGKRKAKRPGTVLKAPAGAPEGTGGQFVSRHKAIELGLIEPIHSDGQGGITTHPPVYTSVFDGGHVPTPPRSTLKSAGGRVGTPPGAGGVEGGGMWGAGGAGRDEIDTPPHNISPKTRLKVNPFKTPEESPSKSQRRSASEPKKKKKNIRLKKNLRSLRRKHPRAKNPKLPPEFDHFWKPNSKPQEMFLSLEWVRELLYGGAAGGGKSEALLMAAARYVHVPGYAALLLRRTYAELSKADSLIAKSWKYYPSLGGVYNSADKKWTFPCSGGGSSTVEFGHMKAEKDRFAYQSAAYDFIGFDELTTFTESMYVYMLSRLRSASDTGVPKRMRAATNPGRLGHVWVKMRFIEGREPYKIYRNQRGITKGFIPATVYDNVDLMKNNPDYVAQLEELPEKERKALLHGDWDIFEGQFFGEWTPSVHVIRAGFIPAHLERYISIDYGFGSFSSVGFWYIDENGTKIRFDEIYKSRLTYEELGEEILLKLYEHYLKFGPGAYNIAKCVADKSIFYDAAHHKEAEKGESGGHILHEIFLGIHPYYKNIPAFAREHHKPFSCHMADRQRQIGWILVRQHLKIFERAGKKTAKMLIWDNCRDLIRTLPQMIHSEKVADDLDTNGEDHAVDDMRYFFLANTYEPPVEKQSQTLTPHQRLHNTWLDEAKKKVLARAGSEKYENQLVT